MNASNIISGFRSTGICPFDRRTLKVPGFEQEEEGDHEDLDNLSEETGLAYIPLFSPAPKRWQSQVTSSPTSYSTLPSSSAGSVIFTEDEIQRFKVRWDNGYDLKHDQRYNQWLEIHHPNYRICSKSGSLD